MIKILQEAFSDIYYLDKDHTYQLADGQKLKSVTKFLSGLKPPFDIEYWSVYKAYSFSGFKVKPIWGDKTKFLLFSDPESSHGEYVYLDQDHSHLSVTPQQVVDQWNVEKFTGVTKGSYIHNYLDLLETRQLDVPKIEIPTLGTRETLNYFRSITTAKELCQQYVKDYKDRLIMIANEFVIGDPELGLAGKFDRLYFNKDSGEYEIWDFKTDKQLRYKSGFGKLNLFDLDDCEFNKYSLQTSLYKYIIEKRTNKKLGKSHIVWFNVKDVKYEIIEAKDFTDLINKTYNENDWATYL